jgi:hypothetical protein
VRWLLLLALQVFRLDQLLDGVLALLRAGHAPAAYFAPGSYECCV